MVFHGHVRQDQHLPCGDRRIAVTSMAAMVISIFHRMKWGFHGNFNVRFKGIFWVTNPGTPVNNITKVSIILLGG